jgi:L-aspartate oxidase
MECLVYARQLSRLPLQSGGVEAAGTPERCRPLDLHGRDPVALRHAIAELRQLCWRVAGVERQGPSLAGALGRIRRQRAELERDPLLRACHDLIPGEQFVLGRGTLATMRLQQELRQRLVLAELLVEAAEFRQESRGGHFRTDAPAAQPFWRRHTLQQSSRPIRTAPVSA